MGANSRAGRWRSSSTSLCRRAAYPTLPYLWAPSSMPTRKASCGRVTGQWCEGGAWCCKDSSCSMWVGGA